MWICPNSNLIFLFTHEYLDIQITEISTDISDVYIYLKISIKSLSIPLQDVLSIVTGAGAIDAAPIESPALSATGSTATLLEPLPGRQSSCRGGGVQQWRCHVGHRTISISPPLPPLPVALLTPLPVQHSPTNVP